MSKQIDNHCSGLLNELLNGGISSPNDVPGLLVWLDANDLSSITKDGSNLVSNWTNKGGSDAATQGTSASQPVYTASAINGKPAINFDPAGTQSFMSIADDPRYNWTGLHVFAVVQQVTDTAAIATVVGKYNVTGNQREWALNYTSGRTIQGVSSADGTSTTVNASTTGAITVGTNIIADYSWDGTNTQAFKNNGSSSGAVAATIFNSTAVIMLGGVTAGATQAFIGYIGEILIYSGKLSTANKRNVLDYLSAKWGIVVS